MIGYVVRWAKGARRKVTRTPKSDRKRIRRLKARAARAGWRKDAVKERELPDPKPKPEPVKYGPKDSAMRREIRAEAARRGLTHVSGDRPGKYTAGGNITDHWVGQTSSWADDYDKGRGDRAELDSFARWIRNRYGVKVKQVLVHANASGDGDVHLHVAGWSG